MTPEDKLKSLTKEAAQIQAWLEEPPSDVPELLAEKLGMANVYLARTGEMLAESKQLLNMEVIKVYESMGKSLEKVGSQLGQKIIAGYCGDQQFLVDWLERLNRGIVHSADNLRTLISLAKENLRLTRYADQVPSARGDGFEEEDNYQNW